jgi:signal transduction histidine kinase
VDGVLIFAFEITDQVLARRKVEEEHQVAEDARVRAEDAVRVRDDFLSIASHELRTPLTTLSLQTEGALRLLRSGDAVAGAAALRALQKIESIRRSVGRLEQLVQGLLDVSRIAAGRLELQLEDVDLSSLVSEVCERFEDEARRSSSSIRLSSSGPAVGRWDALRLDQVFTNLLSNAVKYGQGHPVEVSVACSSSSATVRVQDHGIGVAQEDQDRIFGRFERAVSDRHFGGLGLGLWITRQIVEAMGGVVSIQSAPERGATFTVQLPRGV